MFWAELEHLQAFLFHLIANWNTEYNSILQVHVDVEKAVQFECCALKYVNFNITETWSTADVHYCTVYVIVIITDRKQQPGA